MQTHTGAGNVADQAPQPAHAWEDAGSAPVQTEAARSREEMGMLVVGFGLGLSIGFIFLVYVVLAIGGLLK